MTRYGCLLVALGTPASAEPDDIRDFLRAFLSDRAVVDFPSWLWKPILHGIILRVRPQKIAPIYRSIWTEAGSPLEVYTKAQCELVAQALPDVEVKFAMTYTQPSIERQISEFNADKVVVIPLCPHYAPATVAEIYRQVALCRKNMCGMEISLVPAWAVHQPYINWYREKLDQAIALHAPDKIVFSYHGLPQRKVHEPDSYRQQCFATTQAIVGERKDCNWEITFQSKFGPGKWLQPATVERMAQLPTENVGKILLLSPGFVADCIETDDELDRINRETFFAAGGLEFTRISPLNDDLAAGEILADLFRNQIRQIG